MFEDSLLERNFAKSHRGRATLISFALQVILVGTLVAMPLFFVDALPSCELVTFLVAPSPPPPLPPPAAEAPQVKMIRHRIESDMLDNGQLREPSRIPRKIAMIKESAPPPSPSENGVIGGVPGGIPGGVLGGVIGGIIRSAPVAHQPKLAAPQAVTPQRLRVSQGVTEGLLIHGVKPQYPTIAREARVQGTVVLKVIIAKDGTIQNLQLVSGSPLLAPAAIEAVKEWRYKPYYLNGQPVEVETDITLNFDLG